jgi:hypothetical protein
LAKDEKSAPHVRVKDHGGALRVLVTGGESLECLIRIN